MDTTEKINLLLQMIEHPELFTEEQKQSVLSDDECRKLYDTLADTRRAYAETHDLQQPDLDEEWARFGSRNGIRAPRRRLNIAAVTIGVLFASTLALAAWNPAWLQRFTGRQPEHETLQTDTTVAARPQSVTVKTGNPHDTTVTAEPRVYDNTPLHTIVTDIAAYYGFHVDMRSEVALTLRLHFTWDRQRTAEEVVTSLNHFDKVNIKIEDQSLIVY
jgi:hypothetical protein